MTPWSFAPISAWRSEASGAGPDPRNPDRRPVDGRPLCAGRARLRADLQGLGRIQLRAGGDGAVCRALARASLRGDAVRPRAGLKRADHDRARLRDRVPGAASPGQPGGHHPVHGDARDNVFPRRIRPERLGQRYLQDQSRFPEGSDLHLRVGVPGRYPDRSDRAHCRRHLRRPGRRAGGLFPGDTDWTRASRRRRRSPGGAVGRHPAQSDLADGMGGLGHRRAGRRDDLGRQARRAVLHLAGGAEGAAGADPRRIYLDSRRNRRRPHHRRRREARRSAAGAGAHPLVRPGRRRHRELVRIRACARVPAGPPAGPVRRKDHRADLRPTVLYREVGQFKTSYAADQAIFPIAQDRWLVLFVVAFAFVAVPLFANQYLYTEVLIPVLILSLAAIGLNILTGYCGQLSLGTGGFMAVGAYAAYNLALRVPEMNFLLVLLFSGLMATLVGIIFGLPSLRIKGFYLAVATLASQFFLEWAFARVKWFTNYSHSGSVAVPNIELFGTVIDTPAKKYIFILAIVVVLTLAAKNLVRG